MIALGTLAFYAIQRAAQARPFANAEGFFMLMIFNREWQLSLRSLPSIQEMKAVMPMRLRYWRLCWVLLRYWKLRKPFNSLEAAVAAIKMATLAI